MNISSRQVHLDFHTSEAIPEIAQKFNAVEFAKTVKEAHINSMTVFARCHHGWLYYDSKKFPQLVHPNLKNKNLLLEQVDALQAQGVRAPVYITVQWDYQSAQHHPEWLVRKADGSHEGESFAKAGFYQSLCVNTGYRDFLMEQTKEVCEIMQGKLDGIFFDIVGIRPCTCSVCRAKMKEKELDIADDMVVRKFAKESIDQFKADMTALIRQYDKNCSVFYNAGHVGPCTKASENAYSHYEIESLPSGDWGYLHFPVAARYARTLGKDCLGMTGKFHTSWGDFQSLKNKEALEYECFRMLSHGFAASIGDQLEPNGILQPATYKLIGSVYKQFEQYEIYARPSEAVVEAAVITAETSLEEFKIPDSIFGATQMLEELAIQFDIIDLQTSFEKYKLLFVCEDFVGSEEFAEKLTSFVQQGGKVIAFGKGGMLTNGEYPDCYGTGCNGERENTPDFIIAKGVLSDELEQETEYVMYEKGVVLEPKAAQTVMTGCEPYFVRSGAHFCSHSYTPSAHGKTYPVVTQNQNVLVFSHPLFTQYRKNAPHWIKTILKNAIIHMLGQTIIAHDGPSTLSVNVLHQKEHKRYTLHLLSYIPVRKSSTIDIIEDRTPVHNVNLTLQLPHQNIVAYDVSNQKTINVENNTIQVEKIDGYAVIELRY